MNDNCAIMGCYTTFKHIKTRKVVVLEIEISEENFQEVITKLGMPIGGESKPVAVALLNKEKLDIGIPISEGSERLGGEKLRTRAVLLCKEIEFQDFCFQKLLMHIKDVFTSREEGARDVIYSLCKITSRRELTNNLEAQERFIRLDKAYKDWLFERQHADHLERV